MASVGNTFNLIDGTFTLLFLPLSFPVYMCLLFFAFSARCSFVLSSLPHFIVQLSRIHLLTQFHQLCRKFSWHFFRGENSVTQPPRCVCACVRACLFVCLFVCVCECACALIFSLFSNCVFVKCVRMCASVHACQ